MSRRDTQQEGFSAAELLITLFIATVFVIAGYQLYTYVQSSAANADKDARASNIGYEYLRSKGTTTTPCTSSTPFALQTVAVDGLADAKISVTVTCPYGTSSNVSKITSVVKYGSDSPQKEVDHAVLKN